MKQKVSESEVAISSYPSFDTYLMTSYESMILKQRIPALGGNST